MAEVAISSLVASPSYTASATCSNIEYGFDINESNYAVVQSDANPTWIQIDLGTTKYISSLRLRGGPDNSGSHVVSLLTSTNGTDWTTIATWSSQTYYSTLSPWFTIDASVRYVRVSRTNNNWLRLYYMGVTTDKEASVDETSTITDIAVADNSTEYVTETATFTDTIEGIALADSTSETATLTDTTDFERTTYENTSETATLTDVSEALHLVDVTSETATITDIAEPDELIRKRVKFPNLQGKHLSLKFTSATSGSFAIYYLRHKMFKTRELTSDQKHPNTHGSHLGLKLHNTGTDDFILMYVSEKMQLVTT